MLRIFRNTEGSPSGRLFETRVLRHARAVRLTWCGPLLLLWSKS